MDTIILVTAVQVLFAICFSVSIAETSLSTIICHFPDTKATVTTMIRIVQHPCDEAFLRNAVWNFVTLAVDKELALARLFMTSQLRMPSAKGKGNADSSGGAAAKTSALVIICDVLEEWKEL